MLFGDSPLPGLMDLITFDDRLYYTATLAAKWMNHIFVWMMLWSCDFVRIPITHSRECPWQQKGDNLPFKLGSLLCNTLNEPLWQLLEAMSWVISRQNLAWTQDHKLGAGQWKHHFCLASDYEGLRTRTDIIPIRMYRSTREKKNAQADIFDAHIECIVSLHSASL